jgi:hypothetical protein
VAERGPSDASQKLEAQPEERKSGMHVLNQNKWYNYEK